MDIEEAYAKTYGDMTTVEAKFLFERIPNNVISSENKEMHAIFVKLDDDTFRFISNNPKELKKEFIVKELFKQNGSNIHIIKVFGKGYREFKEIINRIDDIFNPKTITGYRDDFKRLHILKGA